MVDKILRRGDADARAIAWDEAASTFDEAPDHGLLDADVRSAWADLLARILPPTPSRLADLGCGTGSLAVLAAQLGHRVDGIDFSEQMLAIARTKAKGNPGLTFAKGDAASPGLAAASYDAVLCRHVLWALPEPAAALRAWSQLLRPGGRLILIEGSWSTGAGLSRTEAAILLRQQGYRAIIEPLADQRYWGGPITDDRYVATAERPEDQRIDQDE
jgi:ubiquinone/menaquinone biosynthesis C-methylase UbiE